MANTLTLPPNGRGGQTPLDERDGLPVVYSTSVRLRTFGPSTRIQPIVTQQCSGTIGEISNMYVCLYKQQTKKKIKEVVCNTLAQDNVRVYNRNS